MMRGVWTRRKLRKAYERLRPPPPPPDPFHKAFGSACYAPSTSMYFDQFGNVRACCQNTDGLMGNVREQSIREIWDSVATRALRRALADDDYSHGCGYCKWQVDQGDSERVYARAFDLTPVAEMNPLWPVQMEFAMTNACNLRCVMCNGDWSSSIRAHREHRPPLPAVYEESFFEELAEFLPHLHYANFAGGEPFLGGEPLRVMEMISELESPCAVGVVTNGTQWSGRIERICERLPVYFKLSLDGITKATYESIRIGADFAVVMDHLDRFQDYAERHGTRVTITHCLMRPNYHEFAQLLRFAEDRGLDVTINDVLFPTELSLYQLPAPELRQVVSAMEADSDGCAASLEHLRPVWDHQISALRHRLDALAEGLAVFVRPWADPSEQAELWIDAATRVLEEWVGGFPPVRLVLGPDGDLDDTDLDRFDTSVSDRLRSCRTVEEIIDRLAESLGPSTPRSEGSSGLLHDVVLGADAPDHPHQFRVSWDDSNADVAVLIAERYAPRNLALPDPLTAFIDEYGQDNVLELSMTKSGTVASVSGRPQIIGMAAPSELVGATEAELLRHIECRWGSVTSVPGPSGASDWILLPDSRHPDRRRLRIVIERRAGRSHICIAKVPVSAAQEPTPGIDVEM